MRMVSIASGSSGNCIYIGSDQTHILVDAGISNKRIMAGLNELGLAGGDSRQSLSRTVNGQMILSGNHPKPPDMIRMFMSDQNPCHIASCQPKLI